MTIIKSVGYKRLRIEAGSSGEYVNIQFPDIPATEFANFKRADLVRALIDAGIKREDFPKEPTLEELRAAEIKRLDNLANGTVVERKGKYGGVTVFHKISGKWYYAGATTAYQYDAADIVGTGDSITILYPKED